MTDTDRPTETEPRPADQSPGAAATAETGAASTADSGSGAGSPLADAGVRTTPPPAAEYAVPDGVDAATCEDCGRPFPDGDLLALHRGLEHGGSLGAADREAVEAARESEQRRLALFRLRALVVLVVLYFGLLMVYALVT